MKEYFHEHGFYITTDPRFQHEKLGITSKLSWQMEHLALESQNKKNKKIIDKLTQLIIDYPLVPVLKNYLSVAYSVQGNYNKATEINHWIFKEHPDYLFARLNLANEYINNGEPEKVPEVLGEHLDLKRLYPERDTFHLAEFANFMNIVVRYFGAIGDLEMAANRLKVLTNVAPDHEQTQSAISFMTLLRLEKFKKMLEKEERQRKSVKTSSSVDKITNSDAPVFIHAEIAELYNYSIKIPQEKLKSILGLPRQTLVADLEKVLFDARNRYGYFVDLGNDEDKQSFPIHALFLLKELSALESLPAIFEFISYDEEFLDFWLGDHITSTLWQCIFSLGKNNLDLLLTFLLKPGISTFSKVAVSEALCQLVLHYIEFRQRVSDVFEEVFLTLSRASEEDNLIDTNFIGLAVSDTIDCGLKELLPIIKVLFDKEYVAIGIVGDYQAVEKAFEETLPFSPKRDIFTIFELYDDILNTWAGYQNDDNNYDLSVEEPETFYEPPTPARTLKIGRNEPCPCGSGKKYKKCCMV